MSQVSPQIRHETSLQYIPVLTSKIELDNDKETFRAEVSENYFHKKILIIIRSGDFFFPHNSDHVLEVWYQLALVI